MFSQSRLSRFCRFFAVIPVVLGFCILSGCFKNKTVERVDGLGERPRFFQDNLKLAMWHIIDQQQDNGFFRYEFDFIRGQYTHWNNIVNQAGVTYALADFYVHALDRGSKAEDLIHVSDAINAALNVFELVSVPFEGGGYLVSAAARPRNSIENNKRDLENDSGLTTAADLRSSVDTTAMAIAASFSFAPYDKDQKWTEIRNKWVEGLFSFAKKDIDHFFANKNTNPATVSSHLWFALALARNNEALTPDETKEFDKVLERLEVVMMSPAVRSKRAHLFKWDLAAAVERYKTTENGRYIDFASSQVTKLMDELYAEPNPEINSCLVVEGMMDATSLLLQSRSLPHQALAMKAFERSQIELRNSMRFQIAPQQQWLALGGKRKLVTPDLKFFMGAFVNGQAFPQARLSLDQNCAFALLKYMKSSLYVPPKQKQRQQN